MKPEGTTDATAPGTEKVKKNGGARKGSGRKQKKEKQIFRTLAEEVEAHAAEIVEVRELDKTTKSVRVVKKIRALALLDVLFNEGINKKSVPAIKEYFDRTVGRAKQQVEFSGEIKTDTQRPPNEAEKRAALAYEGSL